MDYRGWVGWLRLYPVRCWMMHPEAILGETHETEKVVVRNPGTGKVAVRNPESVDAESLETEKIDKEGHETEMVAVQNPGRPQGKRWA